MPTPKQRYASLLLRNRELTSVIVEAPYQTEAERADLRPLLQANNTIADEMLRLLSSCDEDERAELDHLDIASDAELRALSSSSGGPS
jgi:hypothetical protein